MDWIQRCMQGVELRDPTQAAPTPLDFLVSNETRTLCLTAGWWRGNWGQGGDMTVVVSAPVNVDTGGFDGLSPDLVVAEPTDEDVATGIRLERQRMDVDRAAYLDSLQRLRDYEPDFDFNPWTEAVLARPPFQWPRRLHARRTIGRVRLLDGGGRVLDTLLLDDQGQALSRQEAGWLALFAERWFGYAEAERPDVSSYLAWLVTQPVYVPGAVLEAPTVFSEAGPLATFLERDATTST